MTYLLISLVSLLTATLTLYSGFGLGTLLMPAFAVFFSMEMAVAATAVVHLLNNLFKLALVGRHADKGVVLRFAVPAAVMAMLGARLLLVFSDMPVLHSYSVGTRTFHMTADKLIIAILIATFASFEFLPWFRNIRFDRRFLFLGGALSGFFGGLSGHQGALRAAFLAKAGLNAQGFIATSVVCAVAVDFFRLAVYGVALWGGRLGLITGGNEIRLVALATVSAFAGSWLGSRFVKKVTVRFVQTLVVTLLFLLATALGVGLI